VCAFTALSVLLFAALDFQMLQDIPEELLNFAIATAGSGLLLGGWMSRLLVTPCSRSRRVLDWGLALICPVCVTLLFSELVQPDNYV
jgi:hypothetical protein